MSRQPTTFLLFLLEKGADPNQHLDSSNQPLIAIEASIYRDNTAVLDLLLQSGEKLEHSGALWSAAHRGNDMTVRYLLERGADHERNCYRSDIFTKMLALHAKAEEGHVRVVRVLLEYRVQVDVKDGGGRSAAEASEDIEKRKGKGFFPG